MTRLILLTLLSVMPAVLAGPQSDRPADSNAPSTPRPPLDLRLFDKMEQSILGVWEIDVPDAAKRRVELKPAAVGPPGTIVGVDQTSGAQILTLRKKKEGVGYEGQLQNVFTSCGIETLPLAEFLPFGDAIVMKFETRPPAATCPPIDGGRAGRFYVVSRDGGSVRLRDFGEISSSGVRDTYSIGGDRPNVERTYNVPLGGVSIDDGSEVRFLKRVKTPLDGTYWFEMEAVLGPAQNVAPPRGYLSADNVKFVGSLSLKRVR